MNISCCTQRLKLFLEIFGKACHAFCFSQQKGMSLDVSDTEFPSYLQKVYILYTIE